MEKLESHQNNGSDSIFSEKEGSHPFDTAIQPKSIPPPPFQLKADSASGQEQPFPIQAKFNWGNTPIDSADKVKDTFRKDIVGSGKLKKSEKAKIIEGRWKALQDLADSPDNFGSPRDKQELITMVTKYMSDESLLGKGLGGAAKPLAGDLSATKMLESRDFSPLGGKIEAMVNEILDTRRAFPAHSIVRTAMKTGGPQGFGFVAELDQALEVLRNRPSAKVQMGTVNKIDLEHHLGYPPEGSNAEKIGLIGGDLTIWEDQRKTDTPSTFIQAKTATDKTVKENVEAAANQLASLTASGNPDGKRAEREYSLTGPMYRGAIYVVFSGEKGPESLQNIAQAAIKAHPQFVHQVVFWLTGKYLVVDKGGASIRDSNPLTMDSSTKPDGTQTATAQPADEGSESGE